MYNPLHPIFATPNTGYLFDSWEGVGIENTFLNNTSTLLNENKTIKAKFKIDPDFTGGGNPSDQDCMHLVFYPTQRKPVHHRVLEHNATGWVDINATSKSGI